MQIVEATSAQQIKIAAELFRDYQVQLGVDLCFQGFEQELATLPGKYAAPTGAILLAYHEEQVIGCVAVRPTDNQICEMKRLYVRDEFRGLSAGNKLANAIIDKAKELGYQKMQLDTLERLGSAIGLYKKIGFVEIQPYYANPLDEVVYWELLL
ncbi:MAG: GNAT family N-acetyltransferase [Kangiellaceae bacterium]|nr:GNAT family N-acetyltransferase [Kangiellaceae bacterium]